MRASGLLLPVFSLPSKYGIGTLGKEAYNFIDFLTSAGQKYWQILPLGPITFGNSPYQSFSSYAGNYLFIDLEMLVDEHLLKPEEIKNLDFEAGDNFIDYDKVSFAKEKALRIAFTRFKKDEKYFRFLEENQAWLEDFALFMSIKNINGGLEWSKWEDSLKYKEETAICKIQKNHKEELDYHRFVQYIFFKQWYALKNYANKNAIKIIGDIPIYVAFDSADVWANKEEFLLDENLNPSLVAGCPPDAFSENGQLWGNPLYRWDVMEQNGFSFWKQRISHTLKMCDILRIDHFRGFESYYAIPLGDKNAQNGHWKKGPNMKFFNEIKNCLGDDLPIIAEDLGFLTNEVKELLKNTGFPGMKILQFAFDGGYDNTYLPHNFRDNCIVYLGTHDNSTTLGWIKSLNEQEKEFARHYLGVFWDEDILKAMIKAALSSVADIAILTPQDLLGLDDFGRINTPGELGGRNWKWRLTKDALNSDIKNELLSLTKLYER